MSTGHVVGILGGTGALGSGLAKRWAQAGYTVVVGSRSEQKAIAFVDEVNNEFSTAIKGATNVQTAKIADIVVIAVPFASHNATLEEVRPFVRGKIVLDVVVPLIPPKVAIVQLPREGSAAMMAQKILGDDVRVVSGFHNVGASKLHAGQSVDCDVLLFSDDKLATQIIIPLAEAIGSRGIVAGALANSAAAEAMTSVLIGINRRYKVDGAGIQITGIYGV